jgi:hypothetical protein
MKRILTAVIVSSLMVLPCMAQVGAKKQGDPRVTKLLDKAGLKSTIDSDGDFRLHNEVSDGRSQLIWILSNTSELRDLEIREVWSIAYKSPEPFTAEVANRLLEENCQTKIGAWQMRKMGDDFVAVFSAQVAADTDSDALVTVIDAVAQTADNMEQELSKGDDW